jgi:RND family efflux transporter MFP subunit
VTAGKESLFVVEDMTRIRVQVNVPQAYAVQTHQGTAVMIRIPEAAVSAEGTVTRTASSVDATNRTMLAEIELDNAKHRFQPGSYVQVTFTAKQNGSAWTIPSNTLQMRVEGPHVAVVNDRSEVEIRRVQLGRDLGQRIVVTSGVTGDERLIINPDEELRDGLAVRVAAAELKVAATNHLESKLGDVGDKIAQRNSPANK